MKVRDLLAKPVVSVRPEETLAQAAEAMRFNEVSCLAVLELSELVGVISDHDMLRAILRQADPAHMGVRFYMTEEPVTISADAEVAHAGTLMLAEGVRHLPVMDDGKMIGMISIRDVLTGELVRDALAKRPGGPVPARGSRASN